MADDNIEIEILLDSKSIKRGFDSIARSANETGKKISDSFDGTALLSFATRLSKIALGAAAAGAAISALITKKSISAASEYEDNVNRLNMALAASGQFSKKTSDEFRNFASEIEKTTKFSDDQVLGSAALIQSLSRLDKDGLKKATQASLDLSAALGIDLESASTLVSKAANGNVSSFARYGIEIRKGANDSETFANALKKIELAFPNAAQAAAKTFSGATTQLGNSFDGIFKEIGRAITKSPAVVAAINFISSKFNLISEAIEKSIGRTDIFKSLIINFSVIAQAGIKTGTDIGLSFELAALRAKQAWLGFKVLATAGLSDSFNQQLADVNKQIDDTKNKFTEESPASKFFDDLISKVSATKGVLSGFNEGVRNSESSTDEISGRVASVADGLSSISVGFMETTKEFADKSQDSFKQLGKTMFNTLGTGAGNAFAAFGKALATGQNGLKAFAGAFLASIGQAAVSLGTNFILTGIAYEFSGNPEFEAKAPGLIAAGAALATFGGALSAFGGGGAATAGGGAAASTGGGATSPSIQEAPKAIQEKSTSVKIDVAGTVLDPVSVGKQIAQILNDTFDATGTRVVTA